MMDVKRKKRYEQKLDELIDRLEFIQENLPAKREFLENRIIRKALYKEFQEAVEIVSDIAAMMVKDNGKLVKDDYSNLEASAKILGLKGTTVELLKRAHGLRNVLVHEYNGIVDEMAYDAIREVLPAIETFFKRVEEWLRSWKS